MKNLKIIFLLGIITISLSGFLHKGRGIVDEKIILKRLYPGQVNFKKEGFPPHYKLPDGTIGYNSLDIVPDIRGYGGPISILIVLSKDGKIKNLKIISHSETKNYVHYLFSEKFLNSFIGKTITEPFLPGKDIDAVSRATISERALCDIIRMSGRAIARQVLHLEIPQNKSMRYKEDIVKPIIFSIWLIVVLIFYYATKRYPYLLRFRRWVLLGSVLIVGAYLSVFFSIIHFFQLLKFHISFQWQWILVVTTTLASFIFLGRFYCGWLCPFGALSELLFVEKFQWRLSFERDRIFKRLKYYILLGLLLLILIGLEPSNVDFEPYLTLFSFSGNLFTWAIVILSLAISIRVSRLWCRFLCPVGALSGIVSKSDKHHYTGSIQCPVGVLEYSPNECIRCNRCYCRR